jgi:GrpE
VTIVAFPAGFAADVDWVSTVALAGGLAVAFVVVGVTFGLALGRGRRPSAPPRPGDSTQDDAILTGQRAALIDGCLKVLRLLDDPLLADLLDDALAEAGVATFDPIGQVRDPARHRVDHTLPAADPAQDRMIAKTLIPGYLDGGRVLQPAEVVVYKWERQ